MATRREVREAFYAELESAASAYLSGDDIKQEYPDSSEDLPRIVHNDAYRRVPLNRSAAPTDTTEDASGTQQEIYSRMMQAQFTLLILSDDEDEKEDIYEAVRTYFEKFTTPVADASEIQTDVHRVEVGDANSQDTENRDPPARGDSLQIRLGYERKYVRDTTPMEDVDLEIDVDNPELDDDSIADSNDIIATIN